MRVEEGTRRLACVPCNFCFIFGYYDVIDDNVWVFVSHLFYFKVMALLYFCPIRRPIRLFLQTSFYM